MGACEGQGGRTELPCSGGVQGGGTMLGGLAEKQLMVDMAHAAAAHCPYTYDEVEDMLRKGEEDGAPMLAWTFL